ncbi:solute carrier family member 5 [Stylonychia lemnae]|uniref:Solute carrier family member 5 n=1 Tax=Stylonychia lemnae TaxID=5949 RepID=A0A077ZUM3_STYLE|nr:solute carrier family member 5 [Stylonychia lemnae]|eukprot:CDW73598.1 solute carrier family member 5 [Stylonychia lemnae]
MKDGNEDRNATIDSDRNDTRQQCLDDFDNLTRGLTLEQAYAKIGGFTYFHYWASSLFVWGFTTGGLFFFALSMLEKTPRYLCFNDDGTTYECQADKTFCKDQSIKYKIDWDNDSSLHNWVETLDLTCESSAKIGLIGSIYFVGWAVAAIFLPRLSDLFGRKWVYFYSMLFHGLVYLGLILSHNLNLTIVLMGFFGFCSLGRASVGYLYMQELTPIKQQTIIGTILSITGGLVTVFIALYFLYVSKHWEGFQIFGCATNFLIVVSIPFLPESPKYLISKNRYEDARDSLKVIAYFNRHSGEVNFKFDTEVHNELFNSKIDLNYSVDASIASPGKLTQDSHERVKFVQSSILSSNAGCNQLQGQSVIDDKLQPHIHKGELVKEEQQLNGSLKDLIKIRRHMINLLIMVIIWIASSFSYYLINFQLKYIKGDFFVNTITASLTEVPAYILSGILYEKLGIRIVLVSCFIISLVGGIFLLIFSNNTNVIPVFILLARFGVSATFNICYLANATIFPTIFAGTAFGICNVFAKMATIISPMLAEVDAPVPMTVFCIVSGVATVLSLFIQTAPKKLQIHQRLYKGKITVNQKIVKQKIECHSNCS